jgi:hypothetical protein
MRLFCQFSQFGKPIAKQGLSSKGLVHMPVDLVLMFFSDRTVGALGVGGNAR